MKKIILSMIVLLCAVVANAQEDTEGMVRFVSSISGISMIVPDGIQIAKDDEEGITLGVEDLIITVNYLTKDISAEDAEDVITTLFSVHDISKDEIDTKEVKVKTVNMKGTYVVGSNPKKTAIFANLVGERWNLIVSIGAKTENAEAVGFILGTIQEQ